MILLLKHYNIDNYSIEKTWLYCIERSRFSFDYAHTNLVLKAKKLKWISKSEISRKKSEIFFGKNFQKILQRNTQPRCSQFDGFVRSDSFPWVLFPLFLTFLPFHYSCRVALFGESWRTRYGVLVIVDFARSAPHPDISGKYNILFNIRKNSKITIIESDILSKSDQKHWSGRLHSSRFQPCVHSSLETCPFRVGSLLLQHFECFFCKSSFWIYQFVEKSWEGERRKAKSSWRALGFGGSGGEQEGIASMISFSVVNYTWFFTSFHNFECIYIHVDVFARSISFSLSGFWVFRWESFWSKSP